MKYLIILIVGLLLLVNKSLTLNNGVALTPPMGFLSWERFRCVTDCQTYPNQCISEKLYMEIADQIVLQGFDKLGYNFVNVDDCWPAKERDPKTGRLYADPIRFPSGMKALADYVHSKGLKLGIYTDIGNYTCGGFPGSGYHYEIDAQTFAEWGIDSLKVDGCYATDNEYPIWYPEFGAALNKTGRPIVYYCSWPAYIIGKANFTQISQFCNGWRLYDDISDSSQSIYSIISYWNQTQEQLIAAAGPGAWNDADQLIIGDFGLSHSESQIQMAIWSIIASPMLMSNDIRNIDPEMKKILMNEEVISVSQDPLGKQGGMVRSISDRVVQWWTRNLINNVLAVVVFSPNPNMGSYFNVTAKLSDLGWHSNSANVRDLFNKVNWSVNFTLNLRIAPNSCSM